MLCMDDTAAPAASSTHDDVDHHVSTAAQGLPRTPPTGPLHFVCSLTCIQPRASFFTLSCALSL
jgi:hypothetical protein